MQIHVAHDWSMGKFGSLFSHHIGQFWIFLWALCRQTSVCRVLIWPNNYTAFIIRSSLLRNGTSSAGSISDTIVNLLIECHNGYKLSRVTVAGNLIWGLACHIRCWDELSFVVMVLRHNMARRRDNGTVGRKRLRRMFWSSRWVRPGQESL